MWQSFWNNYFGAALCSMRKLEFAKLNVPTTMSADNCEFILQNIVVLGQFMLHLTYCTKKPRDITKCCRIFTMIAAVFCETIRKEGKKKNNEKNNEKERMHPSNGRSLFIQHVFCKGKRKELQVRHRLK